MQLRAHCRFAHKIYAVRSRFYLGFHLLKVSIQRQRKVERPPNEFSFSYELDEKQSKATNKIPLTGIDKDNDEADDYYI